MLWTSLLPALCSLKAVPYARGDQVTLAPDVSAWAGSLQHKERGTVVDTAAPQSYLVRREADQTSAWYEADEIVKATLRRGAGKVAPGHSPTRARASVDDGYRKCRQPTIFSAEVVTGSSAVVRASTMSNKSISVADLACSGAAAPFLAQPWLPSAPGPSWLEAQFGSRYHVKDVMIHKRYPRGLISSISVIEPRFHGGYNSRTLWASNDMVGCGTVKAGFPSVPQYSFDKVRVEIEHESSWKWDTHPPVKSKSGIVALEFLGVSAECFSTFALETDDVALLRKRRENGYTGCLSSSAPYFQDV